MISNKSKIKKALNYYIHNTKGVNLELDLKSLMHSAFNLYRRFKLIRAGKRTRCLVMVKVLIVQSSIAVEGPGGNCNINTHVKIKLNKYSLRIISFSIIILIWYPKLIHADVTYNSECTNEF